MNFNQLLYLGLEQLKKSPSQTPQLDTEILLSHVFKKPVSFFYTHWDSFFCKKKKEQFLSLIKRRVQGEPVAYLTYQKGFYKDTFFVNPHVLIPRPETECLVEHMLEFLKKEDNCLTKPYRFIDFGCGSGCLGLSLLKELPHAELLALDFKKECLDVCEKNARALKLEKKTHLLQRDLTVSSLKVPDYFLKPDFIVANPPYISCDDDIDSSAKKYEPSQALFSKNQGLEDIKLWAVSASSLLSDQGVYIFEIGSKQKAAIEFFLKKTKLFSQFNFFKDYSFNYRFVFCIK